MAHMVIFQTPDGNPGYNQFDSLEAAISFVETLRNEQEVSNARMFALEELKFELKPFYRVEMAALESGSSSTMSANTTAVSPTGPPPPSFAPAAPPAGVAPVPAPPAPAPPAAPAAPVQTASAQTPSVPSVPSVAAVPESPQGASPSIAADDLSSPVGSAAAVPTNGGDPDSAESPARRGLFGR